VRRWWIVLLCVVLAMTLYVPGALAASWPTLLSGTRGTDVYALQSFLQVRGYAVTVDEFFGSGTDSAVRSFQSANGLTVDGIVGSGTWSKVVVTVQQGSTGQAVKALQRELNRKHHYGLTEDGIFGSGTASAVQSFQSAHGLTADGIVGPATWQQLIGHFEDLNGTSGTGWYHYNDDGNDDYATSNAIAQLKKVAADWAALGYGVRLGFGDFSLPHGGPFPPHSSHQDGLDTDIRCVLSSGEGPCNWTVSGYSRSRTQKLVDMLWATGQVERILFNDPNISGVTPYSGHDDHLHVDWKR
jgi:peptidoglycan hydrolase-like protein with peptidoglycan-binding domain